MALLLDFKTLKTLFQAYAQLDGYLPFESPNPHLASAAMAPHADQYVASVRATMAGAGVTPQKISAVWAGTARTAMMLPAGMTDFFGPIAEEGFGKAVLRMSQETVNGVFALTTRFAALLVGRSAQLPPFEKTLAQTEWAWSVATLFYAVKSFSGRGPASPLPFEVVQLVPASTVGARFGPRVMHAMLSKEMGGVSWGKSPVTAQQVAVQLAHYKGDRYKAAWILNTTGYKILKMVRAAVAGSPLEVFQRMLGVSDPSWRSVTNDAFRRILQRHHGDHRMAAQELGVPPEAVVRRVEHAPEKSPLAHFRTVSDAALAETLKTYKGDKNNVARVYGKTAQWVTKRIMTAADESPLVEFKKEKQIKIKKAPPAKPPIKAEEEPVPAPAPPPPKKTEVVPVQRPLSHLDDVAIATALAANHNNIFRTALHLKCGTGAIAKRIEIAPKDSPLDPFRNKRR